MCVCVCVCVSVMLTTLSVDEILLLRYLNWPTNFNDLLFNEGKTHHS